MTTNAFAAKAALFDLLAAETGTGQPLAGIQVEYEKPGNIALECVYGGGVRFEHTDAVAEPGVLVTEVALVSVYVRVVKEPGKVREADARAAQIGARLGVILKANPTLAGELSWLGIAGGFGDYDPTDDESISRLAYQVRIGSRLTYGGMFGG